MSRRSGLLVATGLVFSLILGGAVPSSAQAPGARGAITSVTATPDGLLVHFRGSALTDDAELDSASLRVQLDDVPVKATVSAMQARTDPSSARRAALVVDTSGSMAGPALTAAKAAAAAYLDAVPPDVEVALVSFAQSPVVLTEPTRDHAVVKDKLGRLTATGGTSLYDAILSAGEVLGEVGQRRILVLSDGADSASAASLEASSQAVRSAGVVLDAVALGGGASSAPALQRLAGESQGRLLQATDHAQAVAAFRQAARSFSTDLQLAVTVPKGRSGGPADLEVQVRTKHGSTLRASSAVLLSEGRSPDGLLTSSASLLSGLLAVFAGLAAAGIALVRGGDRQAVGRSRTEQVLATYTLRGRASEELADNESRIGNGSLAQAALVTAGRLLPEPRARRLTTRLERAAVRFTAREWLVLHSAITIGAWSVVLLVTNFVLAVLAGALAAGAVHAWLALKGRARARAFEAEMPDALQLIASGLATGYSLPQALDSVVNDGRPPVSEELGRALAEARLGAPLESALDNVADRMDSKDFRWVVMAIRVQREVGGNLSEVLTTLVQTMRDRSSLRRQIRALSAEGRLGAIILIALPFFVVAYLSVLNPEFFRPMWETTLGVTLLSGCLVALTAGAFWMTKLVKVEA